MENKTFEPMGCWKSQEEMVAFGLFCAWADGKRAKVDLSEMSKCVNLTAEVLLSGFEALARRDVLDISLSLNRSGVVVAEIPYHDAFEPTVRLMPEDYFFACRAVLKGQKPGKEVI